MPALLQTTSECRCSCSQDLKRERIKYEQLELTCKQVQQDYCRLVEQYTALLNENRIKSLSNSSFKSKDAFTWQCAYEKALNEHESDKQKFETLYQEYNELEKTWQNRINELKEKLNQNEALLQHVQLENQTKKQELDFIQQTNHELLLKCKEKDRKYEQLQNDLAHQKSDAILLKEQNVLMNENFEKLQLKHDNLTAQFDCVSKEKDEKHHLLLLAEQKLGETQQILNETREAWQTTRLAQEAAVEALRNYQKMPMKDPIQRRPYSVHDWDETIHTASRRDSLLDESSTLREPSDLWQALDIAEKDDAVELSAPAAVITQDQGHILLSHHPVLQAQATVSQALQEILSENAKLRHQSQQWTIIRRKLTALVQSYRTALVHQQEEHSLIARPRRIKPSTADHATQTEVLPMHVISTEPITTLPIRNSDRAIRLPAVRKKSPLRPRNWNVEQDEHK